MNRYQELNLSELLEKKQKLEQSIVTLEKHEFKADSAHYRKKTQANLQRIEKRILELAKEE